MKSKIEQYKGRAKRVQRSIEQGECHPSWGKKLKARYEQAIDKKEKALIKKRNRFKLDDITQKSLDFLGESINCKLRMCCNWHLG